MQQIVLDPLTRIEGHLRVEVSVENGVVADARVSGTMARGVEKLLVGRDPRDATYVTERLCGVCFAIHGWTASMAVETAHGTRAVPEAARVLRNLINGASWLHDHVLHFYHLSAVDYLDLSVLAKYRGKDARIKRFRDLVLSEMQNPPVEGQYAGPFVPAYAPDEYSISDLDTVATLVGHYLDALALQVKAKRMAALFSGKQPHQSGIVAGGVTELPSAGKQAEFRNLLAEQTDFIRNVYLPDVLALANGPLAALAKSAVGVGYQNYLAFGSFPEADGTLMYPEGAVVDGKLISSDRFEIVYSLNEDVTSSWYAAGTGGHPSQTVQEFDLEKTGAYSYVKAPRFAGEPMEVGPLARMVVAIMRPNHPTAGHPALSVLKDILNAGVQPGAVARHGARAVETDILCDAMARWVDELAAMGSTAQIHDTAHWNPPLTGEGIGLSEAPRGALGHWVKINNSVIERYACVVPTTWNASPVDEFGKRGPYEEALIGTPVPDPENPINVGRVVRSFDPCLACAVHVTTPRGDVKKFLVEA